MTAERTEGGKTREVEDEVGCKERDENGEAGKKSPRL